MFDGAIEGINFKTNSNELTESVKELLDKIATQLIPYSETQIEIQAHTDSVGSDAYNQNLSE